MRRREFIAGLTGIAVSPTVQPRPVRGQEPIVPIIAVLEQRPLGTPLLENTVDPFRRGLAETGFIDGRNVDIKIYSADGHSERLGPLAADLVRRKVSLIFASTGVAAMAAKEATQTIPVVFFMGDDPVKVGLVASLNHPGGNLTGAATLNNEIQGKRLDLVHKLVPAADLIGALSGPAGIYFNQAESKGVQSAADVLGVKLIPLYAGNDHEIAGAFTRLVQEKAGALLIGGSATLDSARDQIVALAARYAIPTMFTFTSSVRAGGLMSYTARISDAMRLPGVYAGRILKGENPADLPVQQPTRLELAFNLKTANALGLTVPPTLLALADEVIE